MQIKRPKKCHQQVTKIQLNCSLSRINIEKAKKNELHFYPKEKNVSVKSFKNVKSQKYRKSIFVGVGNLTKSYDLQISGRNFKK